MMHWASAGIPGWEYPFPPRNVAPYAYWAPSKTTGFAHVPPAVAGGRGFAWVLELRDFAEPDIPMVWPDPAPDVWCGPEAPFPEQGLDGESEHCRDGWNEDRYGDEMGGPTSCTDVDGGGECVHCECCCSCGRRTRTRDTAEQRAPIADLADGQ